MPPQISILGAGIAGVTTAIALQQAGYSTRLLEAAAAIKPVGAGLGLGANAMLAFKKLGMMEEVVQAGRVLPSFSIFDRKGKLITRTDSKRLNAKYGISNFTIHRAALHQLLLSKIDPQSILLNKKAIDVIQHENSVSILFENGSRLDTEFLVVADGINSLARKKLLPAVMPRYAGYTCWRAVINNATLQLAESSETWGTAGRFGIVPLADNKIYWFACVNAEHNDERFKNFGVSDIVNHFKDFHQPIPALLEETRNEDLIWGDIIDIKPISRFAFGNILLIGDAAHATTPNLGQGACQAIEDAVILGSELGKTPDIKLAFKNFEQRRLKRTAFITNSSWTIGKVAQLENNLLAGLRNLAFRLTPDRVNERQLSKVYDVGFDG